MRAIAATAMTAICLAAAAGLAAQQRPVVIASRPYLPQTQILRAQASEVELSVVVHDRAGKIVYGLDQGDFKIVDNGQPRAISSFSAPAAPAAGAASAGGAAAAALPSLATAPQYVALFMDDYAMDPLDLSIARAAANKFFKQRQTLNRRIGIFTASGLNQLDFTTDAGALAAGLKRLGPHTRVSPRGLPSGPRLSPYLAQLIAMDHAQSSPFMQQAMAAMKAQGWCMAGADCQAMALAEADETNDTVIASSSDTLAALLRLVNYLSRQPGARTLLLASDGFLTQSVQAAQQQVAEAALHANVVIDSLDALELDTAPFGRSPQAQMTDFSGRLAADDVLQGLADATGGEFFTNNNDLAGAMRRMAEAPAAVYRLSFAVPHMPEDSKFHAVKVTAPDRGHLTLQVRKGYYDPGPQADPLAQMPAAELDRLLAGATEQTKLPVEIGTRWERNAAHRTRVDAVLRVDAAKLHFATGKVKGQPVSRERLFFATALYNAQGGFIGGEEGAMTLTFDAAQLAHAKATGITATLPINAPPGRYRLRALVRDSHGRTALLTREVEIPR